MTELLQASYRGSKERQLWRTFEKTTLPGGFFVCGANLRRYSQLRQERFTAKNLFITICYPQKNTKYHQRVASLVGYWNWCLLTHGEAATTVPTLRFRQEGRAVTQIYPLILFAF